MTIMLANTRSGVISGLCPDRRRRREVRGAGEVRSCARMVTSWVPASESRGLCHATGGRRPPVRGVYLLVRIGWRRPDGFAKDDVRVCLEVTDDRGISTNVIRAGDWLC